MRILLAEDDPVARKMLASAMQRAGHELHVAKDGEEAWLFYQTFGPNLVVSDMEMPGQNGLQLCQLIRQPSAREYTYFILVTSHAGEETFQSAMAAGVDDFLSKPIDMASLLARLNVADRILNFHYQINTLKELVPVCMYCKKVREDAGFWQKLETFLQNRIGADISHSVCPECYTEHLHPQLEALRKESQSSSK